MPTDAARSAGALVLLQRLSEVRNQVIRVLQPNREPEESIPLGPSYAVRYAVVPRLTVADVQIGCADDDVVHIGDPRALV